MVSIGPLLPGLLFFAVPAQLVLFPARARTGLGEAAGAAPPAAEARPREGAA